MTMLTLWSLIKPKKNKKEPGKRSRKTKPLSPRERVAERSEVGRGADRSHIEFDANTPQEVPPPCPLPKLISPTDS